MPEELQKIWFPLDKDRWIVLGKLGKKIRIMAYNIEMKGRGTSVGNHRMSFAEAEGGVRVAPKLAWDISMFQ